MAGHHLVMVEHNIQNEQKEKRTFCMWNCSTVASRYFSEKKKSPVLKKKMQCGLLSPLRPPPFVHLLLCASHQRCERTGILGRHIENLQQTGSLGLHQGSWPEVHKYKMYRLMFSDLQFVQGLVPFMKLLCVATMWPSVPSPIQSHLRI